MISPLRIAIVAPLVAVAGFCAGCGANGGPEAGSPPRAPLAGIQDDLLGQPGVAVERRVRAVASLGARVIRVDLRWDMVAARRPRRARDPRDPAYDWSHYDRVVRAARRSRLRVLFTAWGTPGWAADRRVPPSARFPASATRPRDAADFGRFAAAAARRYAPRGVRLWEAWNEPNLPLFLRPQYARRAGRWTAVSPATYRRLLSAFYREVKRVDRRAVVAGGVTAPVGDRCPFNCPEAADDRVPPLDFVRGLVGAAAPPPMDRLSHHPYPVSRPRARTNPRASYVDLYNLERLERLLAGTSLERTPIWLTEFGFATRPTREYPLAFGESQQADFLADAFRRLADRPRVELWIWFNLRDHRAWASGLLRASGRGKPAATVYSLTAVPARPRAALMGERAEVIGQVRTAIGPGQALLQRRDGRRWPTIARASAGAAGTFRVSARVERTARYRVRWAGRMRAGSPARVSRAFTIRVR